MPLRAGFAEVDITPPVGTAKIGYLRVLTIERIRDPIYARAAVFERGTSDDRGGLGNAVGFIALDLLSIRWSTVKQIRDRISRELGFPGERVMVAATHSHGGPAVANIGDVRRDDAYVATLIDRCVRAFGEALRAREPARIGFGDVPEFNVASNRRVVQRTGTARTHGRFPDPNALYIEGPIDPEVAVIAAKALDGRPLGAMVNFACHPVHLGHTDECTAGWPGVFADEMKQAGWPIPLFLQGAAGELHTANPATASDLPMEDAGRTIAADAVRAIEAMTFFDDLAEIGGRQTMVQLPHRTPSDDQVRGTARGVQRFIDPAIYDRGMPALLDRIRRQPLQPAEVQALFLGPVVLVSIPAELFVRLGLAIKERAYPRHALVVAYANGMVGYVPHREAFERGGYETTFAGSSRLAPEAGDLLVDAAVDLIREGPDRE